MAKNRRFCLLFAQKRHYMLRYVNFAQGARPKALPICAGAPGPRPVIPAPRVLAPGPWPSRLGPRPTAPAAWPSAPAPCSAQRWPPAMARAPRPLARGGRVPAPDLDFGRTLVSASILSGPRRWRRSICPILHKKSWPKTELVSYVVGSTCKHPHIRLKGVLGKIFRKFKNE